VQDLYRLIKVAAGDVDWRRKRPLKFYPRSGIHPSRVFIPVFALFRDRVLADVNLLLRAIYCPEDYEVKICEKCPKFSNCPYAKQRGWTTFLDVVGALFEPVEAEPVVLEIPEGLGQSLSQGGSHG